MSRIVVSSRLIRLIRRMLDLIKDLVKQYGEEIVKRYPEFYPESIKETSKFIENSLEKNYLLPTRQYPNLAEGYEHQEKLNRGEKRTCCGHTFWDQPIEYGSIVQCSRCGQFFVKARESVWIIKNQVLNFPPNYKLNSVPIQDSWIPIEIRITSNHID